MEKNSAPDFTGLQLSESHPNYKFKSLKTYSSTEWLADSYKKYRQSFLRGTIDYIYAEVALYNKKFDIEDWEISLVLNCYLGETEVCSMPFTRTVSKFEPVFFLREGWGAKEKGSFWEEATYRWELWMEDKKISQTEFHVINDQNEENDEPLPFLTVQSLRLYENNYDQNEDVQHYLSEFNGEGTRYIYVEVQCQNLRLTGPWRGYFQIKFYNGSRELKGNISRSVVIEPDEETFTISGGWGSEKGGSWRADSFSVEIIFYDKLIAVKYFKVSDSFKEEYRDDFINYTTQDPEGQKDGVKILQIPVELRTAFQQYLLFFKDYVREAKGKDLNYSVVQKEDGLHIEMNADNESEFSDLVEYFEEYLDFARKNMVGIIKVEGDPSPQQVDILRYRLENQISNLQMEIKYRDLKINLLEAKINRTDEEKNSMLGIISNMSDTFKSFYGKQFSLPTGTISVQAVAGSYTDCIQLIENDQIYEALALLTSNAEKLSTGSKNDLSVLKNQWKSLDRSYRNTEITFDVFRQHKLQIIRAMQSIAAELKL